MVGMVCSRFVLKQELKRLWPFILALLSTQSSGGIIMLFMFLIICLWDSYREDRETSFIVKILIVALLISSLFLWDVIQQLLLRLNYDMFSKIFNAIQKGSPRQDSYHFWLICKFGLNRLFGAPVCPTWKFGS